MSSAIPNFDSIQQSSSPRPSTPRSRFLPRRASSAQQSDPVTGQPTSSPIIARGNSNNSNSNNNGGAGGGNSDGTGGEGAFGLGLSMGSVGSPPRPGAPVSGYSSNIGGRGDGGGGGYFGPGGGVQGHQGQGQGSYIVSDGDGVTSSSNGGDSGGDGSSGQISTGGSNTPTSSSTLNKPISRASEPQSQSQSQSQSRSGSTISSGGAKFGNWLSRNRSRSIGSAGILGSSSTTNTSNSNSISSSTGQQMMANYYNNINSNINNDDNTSSSPRMQHDVPLTGTISNSSSGSPTSADEMGGRTISPASPLASSTKHHHHHQNNNNNLSSSTNNRSEGNEYGSLTVKATPRRRGTLGDIFSQSPRLNTSRILPSRRSASPSPSMGQTSLPPGNAGSSYTPSMISSSRTSTDGNQSVRSVSGGYSRVGVGSGGGGEKGGDDQDDGSEASSAFDFEELDMPSPGTDINAGEYSYRGTGGGGGGGGGNGGGSGGGGTIGKASNKAGTFRRRKKKDKGKSSSAGDKEKEKEKEGWSDNTGTGTTKSTFGFKRHGSKMFGKGLMGGGGGGGGGSSNNNNNSSSSSNNPHHQQQHQQNTNTGTTTTASSDSSSTGAYHSARSSHHSHSSSSQTTYAHPHSQSHSSPNHHNHHHLNHPPLDQMFFPDGGTPSQDPRPSRRTQRRPTGPDDMEVLSPESKTIPLPLPSPLPPPQSSPTRDHLDDRDGRRSPPPQLNYTRSVLLGGGGGAGAGTGLPGGGGGTMRSATTPPGSPSDPSFGTALSRIMRAESPSPTLNSNSPGSPRHSRYEPAPPPASMAEVPRRSISPTGSPSLMSRVLPGSGSGSNSLPPVSAGVHKVKRSKHGSHEYVQTHGSTGSFTSIAPSISILRPGSPSSRKLEDLSLPTRPHTSLSIHRSSPPGGREGGSRGSQRGGQSTEDLTTSSFASSTSHSSNTSAPPSAFPRKVTGWISNVFQSPAGGSSSHLPLSNPSPSTEGVPSDSNNINNGLDYLFPSSGSGSGLPPLDQPVPAAPPPSVNQYPIRHNAASNSATHLPRERVSASPPPPASAFPAASAPSTFKGQSPSRRATPGIGGAGGIGGSRVPGIGMFDKAMQWVLDGDSGVDKCKDEIWMMGVRHPGYEDNEDGSTSGGGSISSKGKQREASPGIEDIGGGVDTEEKKKRKIKRLAPGGFGSSKDKKERDREKRASGGSTKRSSQSPEPSSTLDVDRRSLISNASSQSSAAHAAHQMQMQMASPRTKGKLLQALPVPNAVKHPMVHQAAKLTNTSSTKSPTSSTFAPIHSPPSPPHYRTIPQQSASDTASTASSSIRSSASPRTMVTPGISYPQEPRQYPSLNLMQSLGWPPAFYHDFYSRIALTYRSGFPPIPCNSSPNPLRDVLGSLSASLGRGGGPSGRTPDGLTSDAGWGCMLRTGQSLLANALVTVHLGRDWRRPVPPNPKELAQGASSTPVPIPEIPVYARLLSWFMDDPSPLSPFSVHRFALMGKQLGKEVGEWFGPSTAAGAIKTLTNDFAPANLGVSNAVDQTIYKSDVFVAALADQQTKRARPGHPPPPKVWHRPVLILIQLRLGMSGVNPIYYDSIKTIFTFPQSVGIAGGRPSSSYYFLGTQGNSLFYIDPHHSRPSTPYRHPPAGLHAAAQQKPLTNRHVPSQSSHKEAWERLSMDSPRRRHRHASPSASTPSVASSSQDSRRSKTSTAARFSEAESNALDEFFANAYPDSSLRSFHTEKVRKVSMSSLDPSMLVGFLCLNEADWDDLQQRVKSLPSPIFAIQEEMPRWMRNNSVPGGDSDVGDFSDLESFSEPESWDDDTTPASGSSAISKDSSKSHRSATTREDSVPWDEVQIEDELKHPGDNLKIPPSTPLNNNNNGNINNKTPRADSGHNHGIDDDDDDVVEKEEGGWVDNFTTDQTPLAQERIGIIGVGGGGTTLADLYRERERERVDSSSKWSTPSTARPTSFKFTHDESRRQSAFFQSEDGGELDGEDAVVIGSKGIETAGEGGEENGEAEAEARARALAEAEAEAEAEREREDREWEEVIQERKGAEAIAVAARQQQQAEATAAARTKANRAMMSAAAAAADVNNSPSSSSRSPSPRLKGKSRENSISTIPPPGSPTQPQQQQPPVSPSRTVSSLRQSSLPSPIDPKIQQQHSPHRRRSSRNESPLNPQPHSNHPHRRRRKSSETKPSSPQHQHQQSHSHSPAGERRKRPSSMVVIGGMPPASASVPALLSSYSSEYQSLYKSKPAGGGSSSSSSSSPTTTRSPSSSSFVQQQPPSPTQTRSRPTSTHLRNTPFVPTPPPHPRSTTISGSSGRTMSSSAATVTPLSMSTTTDEDDYLGNDELETSQETARGGNNPLIDSSRNRMDSTGSNNGSSRRSTSALGGGGGGLTKEGRDDRLRNRVDSMNRQREMVAAGTGTGTGKRRSGSGGNGNHKEMILNTNTASASSSPSSSSGPSSPVAAAVADGGGGGIRKVMSPHMHKRGGSGDSGFELGG